MTFRKPASVLALILAGALPATAQTETQTATPAAGSAEAPAAAQPAAAPPADATGAGTASADTGGLPPIAPAEASGAYTLDPEHSHIVWSYDHMGFSTSTGVVRGVTGTLTLDGADPSRSAIEASFPLSALRTVSAELDQHMMGDEFFKGASPDTAITFRSTSVEPTGETTARATGDLTLNGQTRPLTLEVELRQIAVDPVSNLPTAGFRATGTLKRSDFGLGAFAPAVSDEVEIVVNAEAKKG